jgi:hypothetical protein
MPQLYQSEESHQRAREALKRRKAKLIAKGINPRGLKFLKLLHRR